MVSAVPAPKSKTFSRVPMLRLPTPGVSVPVIGPTCSTRVKDTAQRKTGPIGRNPIDPVSGGHATAPTTAADTAPPIPRPVGTGGVALFRP